MEQSDQETLNRILKCLKDKNITPHFAEVPKNIVSINEECFWNPSSKHRHEAVYIAEIDQYILVQARTIKIVAHLIDSMNIFYIQAQINGIFDIFWKEFKLNDIYVKAIYSHFYCIEVKEPFKCRYKCGVIYNIEHGHEYVQANASYSACAKYMEI